MMAGLSVETRPLDDTGSTGLWLRLVLPRPLPLLPRLLAPETLPPLPLLCVLSDILFSSIPKQNMKKNISNLIYDSVSLSNDSVSLSNDSVCPSVTILCP
ncbi:unnamed protein product [Staurois parvus]|uniref:Uncharacterized protein n=1 Tax=Staurois parvus TaxID=386267 RepID=A0ABN9HLE9_9NEOB|nr:unnamed protein product [Staurois parvus]